jgi:hypothetical protein
MALPLRLCQTRSQEALLIRSAAAMPSFRFDPTSLSWCCREYSHRQGRELNRWPRPERHAKTTDIFQPSGHWVLARPCCPGRQGRSAADGWALRRRDGSAITTFMALLIDEVHSTTAGEEPGGGRGWPDGNGSEAHQNSRTPRQRLGFLSVLAFHLVLRP